MGDCLLGWWRRNMMIYIYIWYPPPRPILSHNLLLFAVFCCFFLCLNVCFFGVYFIFSKKLCRVGKILPLIKLFSFNRMIFTKPRENQKTKKPKLFRECLVWGSCFVFFWFSSSFFGFFGHDLEKTKNTQGFFGFLKELLLEVRQKNQKNSGLFWFLDRFLEDI